MLERYDYFTKWTYIMLLTLVLCSYMVQCRQKNKREGGGGGGGNAYDHNRSAYDYREHMQGSSEGGGGGGSHKRGRERKKNHHNRGYKNDDLSIWINEAQLKMLSALFFPQSSAQGRLYAIENGYVHNEVRRVYLYQYLTIPAEVNYVNFTWKAGARKYYYNFDQLQSQDESILKAPTVSIATEGQIPREEQNFSVFLPCTGNNSGTAMFNIGLSIKRGIKRKPLRGTPLRLSFKKECAHRGVYDSLDASNPTLTSSQGPDPECNLKCGVNGFCNHHKICQCKAGFTGQYCQTPNCFPMCLNGGNCTAPSVCTCPDGYQGTQCEGGICREKCLNGGKCVQKDKCQCSKGYYGNRCEYSKCVIPCKNDGRCIGNNMCRCRNGLGGNHCEIGLKQHRSLCKGRCTHGICQKNKCVCFEGFYGKACNRRIVRQGHRNR